MMMSPRSTGRRRRDGRHRGEGLAGANGRRIPTSRRREAAAARRAVWVVAAGWALGGFGQVAAQDLVNGGSVALTCGVCECTGTSDDGTITVFDAPSSGDRIASVNAAYSEILTTSCGTPAIATGSTIYELSGLDGLESRETTLLSMAAADCATVQFTQSSTADCFVGPTTTLEFDDKVTVDVTLNFATWFEEDDGATKFWYKLSTVVLGTSDMEQEQDLCFDNGFVSVVFDLTVLAKTAKYNFELDFGDPTSADLPVDGTPAGTDSLVCGVEITPAPLPPPTPAPQTPPPTAAPVDPVTPAPVAAAAATSAPVAAVPETPAPVGAMVTEAPVAAGASTVAPSPAVSTNETTPAPAAAVGGGNETATAAPTPAALVETPVPSAAGSEVQATSSTADSNAELEENACILPLNDPCTPRTPVSNTIDGIGDYYDPACNVPEGQELPPGCDPSSPCRQCYFDTPLYLENNNGSNPDYPDCPCCVLESYPADEAANLDGPRCENVSPAPTTATLQPMAGDVQRSFETLGFDDANWEINPGEAAALAALGLLAALTFFPICSK